MVQEVAATQGKSAKASMTYAISSGNEPIALRALRSMPGTVVIAYDHDLRILVAGGTLDVWGARDPARLTGERLRDVVPPSAFRRMAPRLRGALEGRVQEFSYRTIEDDVDLDVTITPLPGEAGESLGAVVTARIDEASLRRVPDDDPLTGVLSRERMQEEIGRVVATVDRYGEPAVVGVLDLDNFRYVNDAHGHGVGDHLLAQAAKTLRRRLRETDAIGRLGSDEFAFVLPRTGLRTAQDVASDMLRALRDGATLTGGQPVRVSASIGLAPIHPDPGGITTAADLLAVADIAMYAAKAAGRDRVEIADPLHRSLDRARTSLSWAGRIQRALEHDDLVLHAQPILNLAEGRIDRHELLLRMVDENSELVEPGAFLSTAERFGQMTAIDRWVVHRALEMMRAAPGAGPILAVNLSAATLTDAATVAHIAQGVADSGIDPSRLLFEITETAAIADLVRAGVMAERLRALGCRLALDDFGAGFGSLYYLKHLPFDVLKIDGEFIRDLPSSPEDQLTVRAIAQMARGLGKTTVAEYVQDEATVELLRELGVDLAQGHYIGPAAPPPEHWPT